MNSHYKEVSSGQRFEFGENWMRFLSLLNEERIMIAENSLKQMLNVENLVGKTFLDIGSGSGLFSLAAKRLGAKVYSFDYDPKSVACTKELKRRYYNDDNDWLVVEGNALDENFINGLGKFDIVYSWGVLHHTGDMWRALDNATIPVKDEGKLFIALYNDQGGASKRWTIIKKWYNQAFKPIKWLILLCILVYFEIRTFLIKLVRFQNPFVYRNRIKKEDTRGMSVWYDLVDWVGGYPFEVSKPEEVFDFYSKKGFILTKLRTVGGGLACNEFVFKKILK